MVQKIIQSASCNNIQCDVSYQLRLIHNIGQVGNYLDGTTKGVKVRALASSTLMSHGPDYTSNQIRSSYYRFIADPRLYRICFFFIYLEKKKNERLL